MKYFDALKRKKTYIFSGGKEFTLNLNSKDYLNTPIEKRYSLANDWVKEQNLEEAFAVLLKVNLNDVGEDILDDDLIFDLMSNLAAAYARTFEVQTIPVLTPSTNFMENLPISPVTILILTTSHIVNKPLQIIVARSHEESGSYEEVSLI